MQDILRVPLSPSVVKGYMPHMKAERILAENVAVLLKKQGKTQRDLAQWCRHSDVWVSQFLRGERSWQLDDLDRVADFLRLDTYELFRPGISLQTDRRIAQRRVGPERRIGYAARIADELASRIEPARRRRGSQDVDAAALARATQVKNIIADFARRIATVLPPADAGGQTAGTRRRRAKVPRRDRTLRGSATEKA